MAKETYVGTHLAEPQRKPRRKHSFLRGLAVVLAVLLGLYGFVLWAPIPAVERLRNMYIETALSTMTHRWLATSFFPKSIVEEVRQQMKAAQESQNGIHSDWNSSGQEHTTPDIPETPPGETGSVTEGDEAMEAFFRLFWELDRQSVLDWVKKDPSLLKDGWARLTANEAGLKDKGLPVYTTMGEQVLAIDAQQKVLLVRVKGSGYRGVLAIAKDPARLSLQASSQLGERGENAGVIAEAHNGLLAMTGSGFLDQDGHGKGGQVTGYALCSGTAYGQHMGSGYKRLELRDDDLLYIVDASAEVSPKATDAMEFTPALIVDGQITVDSTCGWTALNPRACLGQSDRYEILMLVIEGRLTTSIGTDVIECAKLLQQHGCMQAMNMDGGTSATLYYDGEYVTQCSNTALPAGRLLPNAWIFARKD